LAGKPVVLQGVFKGEMYDSSLSIGGGPIMPGEQPPGIWGGGNQPFPTPPIYIPVPPPPDSGLKPEHPIYIPVYPAHPIVIPLPPDEGEPQPPYVWPPQIWAGPILPPLGIWGPTDPRPTPPIYIPIVPPESSGGGEHPANPIYLPVSPEHPIVLPPDEEGPPTPPPGMVNPPTGQPGFWGYSLYYESMVFVPFEGAIGAPGNPSAPARQAPRK